MSEIARSEKSPSKALITLATLHSMNLMVQNLQRKTQPITPSTEDAPASSFSGGDQTPSNDRDLDAGNAGEVHQASQNSAEMTR